jgi:hypothetical protein
MTARPFMQSLLLASLCALCADAAAQSIAANESTAFRVGIRLQRSCEISAAAHDQPGAIAQVACTRPLPYQVSIDGASAPGTDGALALSLSAAGGPLRQDARYTTVAF